MHSLKRSWNQATAIKQCAYSLYATTKPKVDEQTCWTTSIAEAEKVVGYPTSFLNLRWLLSDEVANVATHLRKLLGTNHPLLGVAKDLILNNEKPSWGLIVLLVSKAGGHSKTFSDIDKDITAGVLHSQRILGEVTEMIRTSNLLHKGLITIDAKTKNVVNMNFGNKIALLCGDYLLSSSFHQLACIKNHDLDELMSSALRDLAESEFIGPRDKHNRPLPSRPNCQEKQIEISDEFGITPSNVTDMLGNAKAEWIVRNTLGGASLLGKSCQGALMLGGYDENFQKNGYFLGKYLALSLKATNDYNSIFNDKSLSPVNAPILFHLQHCPSFYSEFENFVDQDGEIDQTKIRKELQNNPISLSDTKNLQKELCKKTLDILNKFEDCDAKNALKNIVFSMHL